MLKTNRSSRPLIFVNFNWFNSKINFRNLAKQIWYFWSRPEVATPFFRIISLSGCPLQFCCYCVSLWSEEMNFKTLILGNMFHKCLIFSELMLDAVKWNMIKGKCTMFVLIKVIQFIFINMASYKFVLLFW